MAQKRFRKMFGELPTEVVVLSEVVKFDSEGIAEVSDEAAEVLEQVQGYEAIIEEEGSEGEGNGNAEGEGNGNIDNDENLNGTANEGTSEDQTGEGEGEGTSEEVDNVTENVDNVTEEKPAAKKTPVVPGKKATPRR